MKQFLRYIFLLLALFMTTASAWAECYVLSNKSVDLKYSGTPSDNDKGIFSSDFDFDIKLPGKTLSFNYYLDGNASYWHKITALGWDGTSWVELIAKETSSKDENQYASVDIASNIQKIKFKRTARNSWGIGMKTIKVRNVNVTMRSSISASPTTFTFDPIPVGTTATKKVTINYSNIGTTVYASACSPADVATHFALTSAENLDCAGTVELTLTYQPQTEGTHGGTATISGSNGTSCTINVSGSAFAVVDPTHTWNAPTTYKVGDPNLDLANIWTSNSSGSITYRIKENSFKPSGTNNEGATPPSINDNVLTLGQAGTLVIEMVQDATTGFYAKTSEQTITVNKYNVEASISQYTAVWNEIIDNPFSLSYELIDFDVESKNTNIAEYHESTKQIQTYFTDGTAYFQITRPEDYKYNSLDNTLTLKVNAAGGCDVLNATEEVSLEYSVLGKDRIYEPTPFTGIPNELTFYTYKTAGTAVGDIEVQQYVNNKWIAVKDHNNKDVKIDATTSYKKYGPYTLNESATKMRFYNGYGSYERYFKDVQVTRKTYLRPSATEIALPQTNRNKSSENTFNLSWSTCSDDIKLVSNNDLFEVGTTQINTTAHTGTTNNILVRFKGANEPGTYSAVITIYDQSQSKEVHVSCEVKEKLQTRIEYSGEYLYAEVNECLDGLFSVIDENGNTVTGAKIKLSSSHEEILEICGNNSFWPHCGGQVTLTAKYEGDDTYAAASEWSKVITVENCYQTIVWDQSFMGLTADANGVINEQHILTAYATNEQGQKTNQLITYQLDEEAKKIASLTNNDGTWTLHITGLGHGRIFASAESVTLNGITYNAATAVREIRVRKEGDPCGSFSLSIVNEVKFHGWWNDQITYELAGLPDSQLEFYAHTEKGSWNDMFTVDFSADGSNWSNEQKFELTDTYNWNEPYTCTVPENAKYVRFETGSSLSTYFNMVSIRQKTYIKPSVTQIVISDAIVNRPFEYTFTVDYSDVPYIQDMISNSHDLNLRLTRSPETHNDCGEWGTYTFTLRGTSPYPQTNVEETITFTTTAGHLITIPVIITAKVSEEVYYYTQQAGNWSEITNWTINNDQTPATELPTAANPVVISQAVTIDNNVDATAYSVTMRDGGSLTVMPTGGLTVHAGGFIGADETNLTLNNMQSGAGYIRISPYFTDKIAGTMPKIKVLYQTKSTLDSGANKDATWQYIGAPGADCSIYVDHNMWLYLMDEHTKDGWVLQDRNASVALQPFAGYAITQYGQPTYEWTAQLTNANYTLPLTYTKSGRSGRHIFANSYTAPIDIKALDGQITGDEERFRIEKTIYIFNSGSWKQWNNASQTGDNTPGQYYDIPISAAAKGYIPEQTVIPPMQGFYMRVRSKTPLDSLNTTEKVGTVFLDYNQLIMGDGHSDMHTPMRTPQRFDPINNAAFKRIRIHATSANSGADRLYVIQDTICTSKYDNGYDATNQATSGLVNIYTNESAGKMEVSCSNNMDSIYIGFMAGEDSQYTLHFGAECGNIYLKDLENDSIFRMQEGEPYHFTAVPNSTNDLRFQILLYPLLDYQRPEIGEEDKLVTSVTDIPMAQIWSDGNYIYIANAPIDSTVRVYTISGYLLSTIALDQMPYTLDLSHLTAGVYMIQVNNQVYKFICK